MNPYALCVMEMATPILESIGVEYIFSTQTSGSKVDDK